MKIVSINPSNYKKIGEVDVSTTSEIEKKVNLARKAQKSWGNLELEKRVNYLRSAIREVEERKLEIAQLQSEEMGMPIKDSVGGIDGDLEYAKWYLDNAKKYLSSETTFENDSEIHQVFYEPIGVVVVIIPWNFPFANFVWGAMQALIAGNTIVLKHSEECPLCGKLIEEIFTKNLPQGVFNEVYGRGEVGKELVKQKIDMIAFTGSTKTGKYLYETAGKKFIKAVMELGGSAPGIIFDDADLGLAIENVCGNRLYNQGQCCDGLKRLIVHEKVYDQVLEKAKSFFENKIIGNAEDEKTEVGPLVAKKQLDLLKSQVEDARDKGAKILVGGNSLEQKLNGAFFEPTILTDINKNMRVWNEEVFGPVLPIVKFKTEKEATELANQTSYGLGSYVFTKDKNKAQRVAKEIQAGMVSVNGTNYIMPFNPFGGYKNSGFGREHGKYGFHEVTQIKIIAKNKK